MAFHFAWIDPDEEFGEQHLREDEVVLSFDIVHAEGQIPSLSIEIRNPRVGLLAPGRKQWVLFSWVSQLGEVSLLFRGRLVGLPSNVFNEVVTLQFLARPQNYLAEKSEVAQSLKVFPYYDPIWVDQGKLDDPDTILEPYTRSWHIDRTTLEITTSDMIYGEDGVEEFQYEEAFYDSVSLSFAQAPQTRVEFDGSVSWTQSGSGNIDTPGPLIAGTLGGDAWLSQWPKTGAGLQGGWSVALGEVWDSHNTANASTFSVSSSWQNNEEKHVNGDTLSSNYSATYVSDTVPVYDTVLVSEKSQTGLVNPSESQTIPASYESTSLNLCTYGIGAILVLHYEMSRGRTETIYFTMNSALQDMVTSPNDEPIDPIKLSMHGVDVGLPIDGEIPIGSVGRSSFFPTDRGIYSLQYPLLVARAHLLQSARAVKVSFDCSFERALTLSCRKNALLHDPRLVNGQAFGKITEYHIKGSGDSGELIGSIQLEATIGTGGAIEVNEGTPDYVEEGYVSVGYQFYTNATTTLPTNDLTFSIPVHATVDDGLVLPLSFGQVAVEYSLHLDDSEKPQPPAHLPVYHFGLGGVVYDEAAEIQNRQSDVQFQFDMTVAISQQYLRIELLPVQGNDYAAEYNINVGTLIVPKMIDLEGAS